MQLYRKEVRSVNALLEYEYNSTCARLKELRREEELLLVQGASIVAMTTTGAAKYDYLLKACLALKHQHSTNIYIKIYRRVENF